MLAIEKELSKHSRAIEAELADEERALKEIEAEKQKLLRLLEVQQVNEGEQNVVVVSQSYVPVRVDPVSSTDPGDSDRAQPTTPVSTSADNETSAAESSTMPNQIGAAILSAPPQAPSSEVHPSASKSIKSSRSLPESTDGASTARAGVALTVASSSGASQRHNPARLSYSSVDVGRGIEMYSLVYDAWSDVEILGYNEESGMHLCIVRDGGAEQEQWIDLKKKPIRAKQL
jgi:hypothetical protein